MTVAPSRNVLNPGTEDRELPAKCTLTVRSGDVYRHELAGAGGWGNPFERDPERVLRDVLEEKISVGYARREYGVAIDERFRLAPGTEVAWVVEMVDEAGAGNNTGYGAVEEVERERS